MNPQTNVIYIVLFSLTWMEKNITICSDISHIRILSFLTVMFSLCYRLRSHNKRPNRPDVTKIPPPEDTPPNKVARNNSTPIIMRGELDPNSSDHVVAMTQLKEQIVSLQKQLSQKNSELINKDKQVCFFKS